MKNLFLFIGLSLFGQVVFPQASVTVETRARIIEPIKIDKTLDLDFGNVISSVSPGMVILSPDGSRSASGVYISSSLKGNVSPAEAEISHGNNSYSITLPESFRLYNQENPDQVLLIDTFTVVPDKNTVSEGRDIIKIGGTLHLEAGQLPGFYTNSTGFNVTVSYN